jgi:hypothetical protein
MRGNGRRLRLGIFQLPVKLLASFLFNGNGNFLSAVTGGCSLSQYQVRTRYLESITSRARLGSHTVVVFLYTPKAACQRINSLVRSRYDQINVLHDRMNLNERQEGGGDGRKYLGYAAFLSFAFIAYRTGILNLIAYLCIRLALSLEGIIRSPTGRLPVPATGAVRTYTLPVLATGVGFTTLIRYGRINTPLRMNE